MSERHHSQGHEPEAEGRPIVPEIIFTRDRTDPRYFARPGETGVSGKAPSRAATWFSVAVIVFVLALGVFAVVSSVVGGR